MTDFVAEEKAYREWSHARSAAYRQLRSDLTDEQKLEAARIGRIEFVSAGAKREQ